MPELDPAPTEDDCEYDHDRYLRALASLENLRKQKSREVEAARDQGEAAAISAFLPIIDDMYRAMEAMGKPRARKKDILDGVQFVFDKFRSLLDQLEVNGFESEGQKFTYELMEAVVEVPTADALPGTVVGEAERGYMRKGKLLRPAKVAVAVEPKEGQ